MMRPTINYCCQLKREVIHVGDKCAADYEPTLLAHTVIAREIARHVRDYFSKPWREIAYTFNQAEKPPT
jgi:hypothetical protein